MKPAIEVVKSMLAYDPATGDLVWVSSANAGSTAGWENGNGYRRVSIGRKGKVYAHHIAWLFITGAWPTEVDHINGDRSDNRAINLRHASRAENNRNSRTRKHNKSGLKGVRATRNGTWSARIRTDGCVLWLGTFPTPEEAHQAYCQAAIKQHGDFARLA